MLHQYKLKNINSFKIKVKKNKKKSLLKIII
jgi:hypothetical protein